MDRQPVPACLAPLGLIGARTTKAFAAAWRVPALQTAILASLFALVALAFRRVAGYPRCPDLLPIGRTS